MIAANFHPVSQSDQSPFISTPELLHSGFHTRVPSDLPHFRGKDGTKDPEEFITRFNRVCSANGIPLSRFGTLLAICLENNDAAWLKCWIQIHTLHNNSITSSWSQIQDEFMGHFQNANSVTE